MSNAASTYEVLIKTPAELSGAQATLATLEKNRGAAIALGESLDQIDAKIARVRGAIAASQAANPKLLELPPEQNSALEQLRKAITGSVPELHKHGEAMAEASGHAEGLHVKHELLKKSTQALGAAVPEVGMALHALLGPVAAVMVAAELFNKLTEKANEYREMANKVAEETAHSLAAMADAHAKNLDESARRWDAYDDALKKASESQDPLNEKFARQEEQIKKVSEAMRNQSAALKQLAIDQVNADVNLSDDQKKSKVASIESSSATVEGANSEAERKAEAQRKREQAAKLAADAEAKKPQRNQLETEITDQSAQAAHLTKQAQELEERDVEIGRKINEAREKANNNRGTMIAALARRDLEKLEKEQKAIESNEKGEDPKSIRAKADAATREVEKKKKDQADLDAKIAHDLSEQRRLEEEAKASDDDASKTADITGSTDFAKQQSIFTKVRGDRQAQAKTLREKPDRTPEEDKQLKDLERPTFVPNNVPFNRANNDNISAERAGAEENKFSAGLAGIKQLEDRLAGAKTEKDRQQLETLLGRAFAAMEKAAAAIGTKADASRLQSLEVQMAQIESRINNGGSR